MTRRPVRPWLILAGSFSFIAGLVAGGIAAPGASWWAAPATAGPLARAEAAEPAVDAVAPRAASPMSAREVTDSVTEPATEPATEPLPAVRDASAMSTQERAPQAYVPVLGVSPWQDFPWGGEEPEKACPHPRDSPGALLAASDPRLVVVVGDSLVRNARDTITAILEDRGFSPVFVCWGGRTLAWGVDQVTVMKQRALQPRCLVVNLGVNDVHDSGVAADVLTSRVNAMASVAAPSSLVFVEPAAADESRQAILGSIDYSDALATAHVIRWSEFTAVQPELVSSDAIHDSPLGVTARSALIGAHVEQACG